MKTLRYYVLVAALCAASLCAGDSPTVGLELAKKKENYRLEYLSRALDTGTPIRTSPSIMFSYEKENPENKLILTSKTNEGEYTIQVFGKLFELAQNDCDFRGALSHEHRHIEQLEHLAATPPQEIFDRHGPLTDDETLELGPFLRSYLELDAHYAEAQSWECMSPEYRRNLREVSGVFESKLLEKPKTFSELVEYFRKDLASRKPKVM